MIERGQGTRRHWAPSKPVESIPRFSGQASNAAGVCQRLGFQLWWIREGIVSRGRLWIGTVFAISSETDIPNGMRSLGGEA
jgi:hypothetical protein